MTAPDRICLLPSDGWSWMAGKSPHEEDAVEYVRADLMQELIDAYEDIMDYGIVLAKKAQQDRLKAAKEKL